MLPENATKVIEIENEKQREKTNNLELKQKMIEQGLYSNVEINKIFSDFNFSDEINKIFQLLNIKQDISFYDFYSQVGFPKIGNGEELFTLDQILENYQSQNWITLLSDNNKKIFQEKYPNAGKKYLQITSIEGGGSYFYDKETDYVYDIDYGQEENMVSKKLEPLFTSFYDFLEWYYSEEDEN